MTKPEMPKPERIGHKGLRRFYEMGWTHLEKNRAAYEVRPDTAEWSAWEQYFRERVRGFPAAWRMAERKQLISVTMPCQWPEWLDTDWAARRLGAQR